MKEKQPIYSLQYDKVNILYELHYDRRKTLKISILPNQKVIVTAPIGVSMTDIEKCLSEQASLIIEKMLKMETQTNPLLSCQYVDGEVHWYLGNSYQLKIIECQYENICFDQKFIYVYVRSVSDSLKVRFLLDRWYYEQAQSFFRERLTVCYSQVKKFGITYPEKLVIRAMKTRWGSCTPPNKITLNLRLIHIPIELIDYVILHELGHLKEASHNTHFYNFMDQVLPDWRERRGKLNIQARAFL